MGRRVLRLVLLLVSAIVTVAMFAVAPNAIHDRIVYGTFATADAPPRVDFCGRTYYPADKPRAQTLSQVADLLSRNGIYGLTRIDTAPSGDAVVANVMSPEMRARFRTNVCTMVVWVQTGPDSYVSYGLSGGP